MILDFEREDEIYLDGCLEKYLEKLTNFYIRNLEIGMNKFWDKTSYNLQHSPSLPLRHGSSIA